MEQPGCNTGRLGGGEGGLCREATKAFRTPGIFLLISSSTTLCLPPPQRHLQFSRFKNQNIFPQIAAATAAVLMKVCMQHVPMKRQNLSKTLKVAKKSISSHKLFIIIVTSTIHYATENNCKEISQDRNLVRMHMHRFSGRLPKQTICQIVFFSFCKLKWDPPCRFLVFQVEPKIYYFTDPDTMT